MYCVVTLLLCGILLQLLRVNQQRFEFQCDLNAQEPSTMWWFAKAVVMNSGTTRDGWHITVLQVFEWHAVQRK